MELRIMVVIGLALSEKMVEYNLEENWVHWGQAYQGDEQIAYGCCDQHN